MACTAAGLEDRLRCRRPVDAFADKQEEVALLGGVVRREALGHEDRLTVLLAAPVQRHDHDHAEDADSAESDQAEIAADPSLR